MKLTDGEKLITTMLCDLCKKLDVEGINRNIDYDLISSAIDTDNLWAIKRGTDIPFESEEPEIVKEVEDILIMWYSIEISYEKLSSEDKAKVDKVSGKDPKFKGFNRDNPEDDHHNIANFFVNELHGRHLHILDHFKLRDLDSHGPSKDSLSMLSEFEERKISSPSHTLSADDLIAIFKEETYYKRRQNPL